LTLSAPQEIDRSELPANNGRMPKAAPVAAEFAGDTPTTAQTDGRRAWRDRNRLAVVDALLDLYAEGNLRPGASEVAARSGVSRRSVFRYFDDLDDLDRTAIARQQERVKHLVEIPHFGDGPVAERIAAIAEQRVRLFDAVAPAARVSRMRAPVHKVIAEELAQSRQHFTRQVERQFAPELSALDAAERLSVSAAADAVCSFEAFDLLKTARGMSNDEVRRVIEVTLAALFAAKV